MSKLQKELKQLKDKLDDSQRAIADFSVKLVHQHRSNSVRSQVAELLANEALGLSKTTGEGTDE